MPIDSTITPDDTQMFAPIPSWERNRKRRAFGASRPARVTTTTVADDTLDPLDAPADTLTDSGGLFAGAPIYATRAPVRRSGGAAMAIAAGLIAVGGLGAAAWYATQPHDSGMAQLTPGSTATTTTTVTPGAMALNDAKPAAAPATHVSSAVNPAPRTTTTTTTTRIARARPASSRSADDAGVNASATLPQGPMPYTGQAVNPAPAPAAAAPVEAAPAPSAAPVESAPAPAPVQSIPEPSASAPAPEPAPQ
jgi:hypothetical protein